MPTSTRSIIWLVAGLTLFVGPNLAARQFALPKAADEALDERWATWSLATIDPGAMACAADARPAVTLDIDGDGLSDVAALVQTPDGVRLVALLSRLWGYDLYDIDALGETTASGYLTAMPRGTAYVNPRTAAESYLSNATMAVRRCGMPEIDLYLWYGFRFEKTTATPRG